MKLKTKLKKPKKIKKVVNVFKRFKPKEKNDRDYPAYKRWRTSVYRRDKFTCRCCGKVGGMLNAHHILNYSSNPKLRLVLANGVTMCVKCHNKFHKRYGTHNNTPKQLKRFFNKIGGRKWSK